MAEPRHIFTGNAPTPGAYSQAILVDPLTHLLLFIAGQTGNDPSRNGEPVVDGGVGPQTTRGLNNMLGIVRAAGGNAGSFVAMDVFIKDGGDQKAREKSRLAFDAAYRAFFSEHGITPAVPSNMPTRFQVWVPEVPWESEDTQIEIRGIAAIPRR